MMFEEKVELFYSLAEETWQSLNLFVKNCRKFQEEWRYKYAGIDICEGLCKDAFKEMELMKGKLTHNNLKCVVIGKVSSGKSTLINAILSKNILPHGFSCRTNCFIEVKKSLNGRNYILIGNEEKNIDSLKGLADDFSPEALPQGSYIELFVSLESGPLLTHNIAIIDTPGFDDISELDSMIVEKCNESNMIILVVSSIVGLGEIERNFIRKHQTIFTKFNILILYSFWDKPQSENPERSNKMRTRLLNQAKQYLENDLRVSLEGIEEKIFFISAEEKLLSFSNNQSTADQYAQCRNNEFDQFLHCLQVYISKNSHDKQLIIINELFEMFNRIYIEIEYFMEEIISKKNDFVGKLHEKLCSMTEFSSKIIVEAEGSFKEAYNTFFDKSLALIKSDEVIDDEEIIKRLDLILQELMVVTIESLKNRIIESVEDKSNDQNQFCIHILKTLYFPFYFNLDIQMKSLEMDSIHKCFTEINRIKKLGTGLSIGGAVIGTAATLASGGILAGIVLPIPTLFGASVLGFAGAAVGGSAGGGVSSALLSLNREAFSYFYKNQEDIMKVWWKEMETHIEESYKLFIEQLPIRVNHLLESLKEEFNSLPNKINFLKSEACRIKNMH